MDVTFLAGQHLGAVEGCAHLKLVIKEQHLSGLHRWEVAELARVGRPDMSSRRLHRVLQSRMLAYR